jgi:hypothetical protein
MGEMRGAYNILFGKPGGDHYENLGVDGRITNGS